MKSINLLPVIFLLTGCGGGSGGDNNTPAPPPANVAPTITAIDAQAFDEQADYTVTATANDSDGNIASYAWTQLSGDTLTLTNTDTATVNITTPDITTDSSGQLQIIVTDDDGATTTVTVDYSLISKKIKLKVPSEILVEENTLEVVSLVVDDAEDNSFELALSGSDSPHFNISDTGVISFRNSPNYESPADNDSNNIYSITITVNDTINTDSIDISISVTDKPFFGDDVIELEDGSNLVQGCQYATNVRYVIPFNLNDDNWKDFIIVYTCPLGEWNEQGIAGPSLSALVAYKSNEIGVYTIANEAVFGQQYLPLGSDTRNYRRGDLNGDGVDDFAFATNNEDGRYIENNNADALPTVLLSGPNNTYSVHHIGIEVWGHAVGVADNGLGYKDVLFAGFGVNTFQAYRFDSGAWSDVTNKYPTDHGWATSFAVVPSVDSFTESKYAIGTASVGQDSSIRTHYKAGDDWVSIGDWVVPYAFSVTYTAWTGNVGTLPIYILDGKTYAQAHPWEMCVLDRKTEEENPIAVVKFNLSRLPDNSEFIEGEIYQENFIKENRLMFFELSPDKQTLLTDMTINEQRQYVDGNYMQCMDINDDGLQDVSIAAFHSPWRGQETYGAPFPYIQNNEGKFEYFDVSKLPSFEEHDVDLESEGFFSDINNDGIIDLILKPLTSDPSYEPAASGVFIHLGSDYLTND